MKDKIDGTQVGISSKRKYSSSKMSYLDVTVNSPILQGSVYKGMKIKAVEQEVNTVDVSVSPDYDITWE